MISVKRILSTYFVHLLEESASARWILLSSVLAAVGVLGIYVAVPAWINYLLAAVSLVLLVIDVRRYRSEQRRITFMRRPLDNFTDVKASLESDDRSRVITVHGQTFIHDEEASKLIGESALSARLLPARFVLSPELKSFGGRFRRERVSKESTIFNGPSLGWASSLSDIRGGQRVVDLVQGTYFDRLATDYFAAVDTRRDGAHTVIDGRRLFIDRHGKLRDFDTSWLFNGIGVSTIALTSDGMFVVAAQSGRNVGEKGLLAPSGSGSLEPKDFGTSTSPSIAELAIAGATRELQEEASIEPHDIVSSHFLGFGRWLDKAAAPEMFCVTLLKISSHELRRRKRRKEERVYVDGVYSVRPVGLMAKWDESRPELILPESEQGRLSLPLGVALSLLIRNVQTPGSSLTPLLEPLFNDSPING